MDKHTKAKLHWIRTVVQRAFESTAKFNDLQRKYDELKAQHDDMQNKNELIAAKGKRRRTSQRLQSIVKTEVVESPAKRTRAAKMKLAETQGGDAAKNTAVENVGTSKVALDLTAKQQTTGTALTRTSMPDDEIDAHGADSGPIITTTPAKGDGGLEQCASEKSEAFDNELQDNDSYDDNKSDSEGFRIIRNKNGLIVCTYNKKLHNGGQRKNGGGGIKSSGNPYGRNSL